MVITYHPIYGNIQVPDEKAEIEIHIELAKDILIEGWSSLIQAYLDMLESQLDLYRRIETDEI